jgi:hypothetical protein
MKVFHFVKKKPVNINFTISASRCCFLLLRFSSEKEIPTISEFSQLQQNALEVCSELFDGEE